MRTKIVGVIAALTLTLSACSPVEPQPLDGFDGLTIVSSTNVWGDIAKSVAGDDVRVISIIDSVGQDPHSYEASVRDQLAVNEADIVVANGGGYDPFIDVLAEAAGGFKILYAYSPEDYGAEDSTGEQLDHTHENEHVWYDFHIVEDFATRVAEHLGTLDPDRATKYAENLVVFIGEMERLQDDVARASQNYQGYSVLSSEPVADYLLAALGFENITPSDFSQAIEEETDIAPQALLEVQNLLRKKLVKLFVVNPQTGSSQIESLVNLAKENGIAVVELSELLPEGIHYSEWMSNNIASIEGALN